MDTTAKLYQDLDKILVTKEEIHEAVVKLGKQITEDFQGKDLVLIGILKGAIVFYADLMREIDLPLRTDFMAVSSYGSATKTTGVVKVLKDLLLVPPVLPSSAVARNSSAPATWFMKTPGLW